MRAPIESITMIVDRLIYQKAKELTTVQNKGELALLRAVHHSSKMMSFLMSDLLDNQLLQKGVFSPNLDTLVVKETILEVTETLQQTAKVNGNKIKLLIQPSVPDSVQSDKNRFKQVLMNLLTNANKFTRHGLITISCSFKAWLQPYPLLVIKVTDSGVGMSSGELKSLFKPFSKLESHAQLNPNGVGLGLSICQKILKELNGFIRVNSCTEEGANASKNGK